MTFRRDAPAAPDAQAINARASVLMKQGIRLLDERRPETDTEALACFDQALALRQRLPIDEVPLFRFGLAACWLNRADVLVRLGGDSHVNSALQAYDEGIRLLRGLHLGEDPRFPRRLAIAHQNRGLAFQAKGRVFFADAVAAFQDAIAVLDDADAAGIPDRQYLLAAVWVNLASARAAEGAAESGPLAREAAQHALALVTGLESDDVEAAEVGLRARHVVCQTMAGRLMVAAARGDASPDDVHEATDAVDDGLDLVSQWERRGVGRFRALARDLFRFGARVYARYQPQFLHEFVREHMDPARSSPEYVESAEMREAAEEALNLRGSANR